MIIHHNKQDNQILIELHHEMLNMSWIKNYVINQNYSNWQGIQTL
jgi:hypothetical protein